MFTQKFPDSAIEGHERDDLPGRNPTSGGSSDTDTKEPMVMPCGLPERSRPVTTVTPVGK